ncbi:MAG: HAD family phosphatase [Simkania sp.]|nr:HAD family phosphatase [Simkania sp.]MCP5490221.1 HAD family phosphatase [Chlamydiales bacterium]
MGKYSAVIFDMGNVLISFSFEKMLSQVATTVQLPVEKVKSLFVEEGIGIKYERGEVSSRDLYNMLSEHSPVPFEFTKFIEAGCDIFTPRSEMVQIVKQLKAKGIRLILLSNTNEAHYQYISKHYDFLPLFDHLILSYKVHRVKPEKEIYQEALFHANASPHECFYIDDIAEYVHAARKLGIKGHVYESHPLFLEALQKENIL